MNVKRRPCSPQTLEDFLADRLSADSLQEFENHLETCPACRENLEHLAAEGPWWEEARGYLACPQGSSSEIAPDTSDEAPSTYAGLENVLAPTDDPRMLGRLGGYEVAGIVGSGGMGIVLKAFDAPLGRYVAIKVLAPQIAMSAAARQRFAREAKAAATVVHANVIAIHAVAEANGVPYFVMPYVRGPSLEKRLQQTGALPVIEIVRIGMQIAAGLAAAHAQGLVHRDIKPGNILLEEGVERATITDFGLARAVDDASLTRSGEIAGTPQYMSPEQASGGFVDHRSDLFSLGSVLYALCTGRPPFRAETALGVLRLVEENRPRSIREINPEIPDWLAALIERLQAKNPADRFQSAAEVANLLEGYLAYLQQPTTLLTPKLPGNSRSQETSTGATQRTYLVFSGLVLLTLISIGGLVAWLPRPGPTRSFLDVTPGTPENTAFGPVTDFYQDFRGSTPPGPGFQFIGFDPDITCKPEDGGLRITVPGSQKRREHAGLELTRLIRGNFEIRAGYEILAADQPEAGYGVGFELYVHTQSPERDRLGFFRVNRVKQGESYMVSRGSTENGKNQYQNNCYATTARSGQLKVTRRGTEATAWAAEGFGGPFEEVQRTELGAQDVTRLVLAAYAGLSGHRVDLRIVDVKIRAGLADSDEAVAAGETPGGAGSWLALLGFLGLILSAVAVRYWLVFVRRRSPQ